MLNLTKKNLASKRSIQLSGSYQVLSDRRALVDQALELAQSEFGAQLVHTSQRFYGIEYFGFVMLKDQGSPIVRIGDTQPKQVKGAFHDKSIVVTGMESGVELRLMLAKALRSK